MKKGGAGGVPGSLGWKPGVKRISRVVQNLKAQVHCEDDDLTWLKTKLMDDEKSICSDCIEDPYVRNLINSTGDNDCPCSYCNSRGVTVSLEKIANLMHEVFEKYYNAYSDDFFHGGSSEEEVISEELGVEEEVYKDILEILCEIHNDYDCYIYGNDYVYEQTVFSVGEYDFTWNNLRKSLRTKTRFFNSDLRVFLDKIFSGIETMRLETGATIRQLDSSHVMYRARAFEDYRDVEKALAQPARNFGPPPSVSATSGRMNPHGVPVFYGAMSRETAIAEIRPAVGSLVVIAPFRPRRVLNLLDLSSLEHLVLTKGSLFDPGTQHRIEVTSFLKTLSRKLTIPVFGKTRESEYLITQAVAEYLSLLEAPVLDGIMFHSTQSENPEMKDDKGYNVVLFSKSSIVSHSHEKDFKYGVNMYENAEYDEWYICPSIYPESENVQLSNNRSHPNSAKATLEIDVNALEIHTVRAVRFSTDMMEVELRKDKPLFTRN